MKFWDLDTQHCFKTLVGHRTEVGQVCLTAAGFHPHSTIQWFSSLDIASLFAVFVPMLSHHQYFEALYGVR